jgi:putative polyhydroxyalkanoate system protein
MARTISVSHRSTLDLEEIRTALRGVLQGLKDRYEIEGEWKSDRILTISGPSVSGMVHISDNKAVTISVSLGAMLAPFASLIENHIKGELVKNLGP